MEPITIESPESKSADIVAENVERLRELFPSAFDDGDLDLDVLRQLVGGTASDADEHYGLTWHGKHKARAMALSPSQGTLRPAPTRSIGWDDTRNVFIEGDNLEAVKLLLKAYAQRVKLLYIDPPYNTGNDFVYPDDYRDSINAYLRYTGKRDDEGMRTSSNPESSGRFHTNWLNMMYPRLFLARSLLRRDGVIFASIDESELPRLRFILDEIFGVENFVAEMVWAAGRKNDSKLISVSHEYIVCYARDKQHLADTRTTWRQRKKGLEDIYAVHKRLLREHGDDYPAITAALKSWFASLPDGHPAKLHRHYSHVDRRGVYFPDNISWPGGGGPKYEVLHPVTGKPVVVPSRGWLFADPQRMQELIDDDRVQFGEDETRVPCIKAYLADRELQTPYSVFYQDGRAATKRLRDLMGGDYFSFPKDERVLQELIEMTTAGDDLVMDFFAGSGSTGHAVMAQNAADGGQRSFVLVQLPEPLDASKKEQAAAVRMCEELDSPHVLSSVTIERLRRAGETLDGVDAGFRVFELDSSNLSTWDADPGDISGSLLDSVDHVKPGRSEMDLLFEILLKLGLELTTRIERRDFGGITAYGAGAGTLVVCVPERIDRDDVETVAQGITSWVREDDPAGETRIVFRDSAFVDDVTKSNMTAILEQNGFDRGNIRSV